MKVGCGRWGRGLVPSPKNSAKVAGAVEDVHDCYGVTTGLIEDQVVPEGEDPHPRTEFRAVRAQLGKFGKRDESRLDGIDEGVSVGR